MATRVMDRVGRTVARLLDTKSPGYEPYAPSDPAALRASLRPGDVLLVEGDTRLSAAIKYLTQSTWSHAALCLGREQDGDGICLVDADVLDGVRVVPLSEFDGLHARICRPVGLSAAEIERVAGFMLTRIGDSYDLKNVFDLARYLLRQPPLPDPLKRRILALGSGEPTRAICSTLLAQAFESVRYPILPEIELLDTSTASGRRHQQEILHIRHYSLYTPRDFDVSPFFQVVKPRIEAGFDFHALRWSGC